MKLDGTITYWNDDRGFGFIEPVQGGSAIFAHVKAFGPRTGTPQAGQRVTFEMSLGPDGQPCAGNVAFARGGLRAGRRRAGAAAPWKTASLLAIPAFLLVCFAVALAWGVSPWIAAWYAGASLAGFLVYAFDKSAAVAGRRRVSERTLLLLGLAGGWPGALVAQQVIRHKSSKAPFRWAFWGTVVFNGAAFVVLHSPFMESLHT